MSAIPCFVSLAERGLFVYDWSYVHRTKRAEKGTCEAVVIPSTPIIADALPPELGFVLRVEVKAVV